MRVFRAVVRTEGVGCEGAEDEGSVVDDGDGWGGAQPCVDYVDGEGKEDEVDGRKHGEPGEG